MTGALAGRLAVALIRDLAQLPGRPGLPCLIGPRPTWLRPELVWAAERKASESLDLSDRDLLAGAHTTYPTDPGTLSSAPTTPRGHLR